MANKRFLLGISAMVLVFGLAVVGCGGGGGDDKDSRLILPAGHAWIIYSTDPQDSFDIYADIFNIDGTVQYYGLDSSHWIMYSHGTWSTSGNILTMTDMDENGVVVYINTYYYTVTSNTLTIINLEDEDNKEYTYNKGIITL